MQALRDTFLKTDEEFAEDNSAAMGEQLALLPAHLQR
jgi:hypothetical protein